jgi:two-component system chemotaxis response regulator CheY
MVRIVIVDDEVDYTEILKDYCELNDIEVVGTGHNGKDAVKLCKEHSPDFLLLDLSMPEFNGFYALENIHKTKSVNKIIILTGLLTEENTKNLTQYNIFSTLIKPVDPEEIIKKIQSL